jgi:hypothetical protein
MNMKKNRTVVGIVLALQAIVVSSADAIAQEFLAYEGKNAIQEGEDRTKKVVDCVEFWADG